MASNVVRATLLADAQRFKAGFKEAEGATTGFEKRVQGTAVAAKAFLATAAVAAVKAFADDAVRAFSEVEQSTGSVESVFGAAADTITRRAKSAAQEFGLSMSDFQESAALTGAMLKNQLGLGAEEAADKSIELIGVASDMAATFGGTTSEAISAIGSLLRGERDPIEKYAVSMNEADVQARAMAMGLAESATELDKNDKAAAALDLLFEQTADSAGQFARESDTLAGKQQRLNAQMENNKALVGQALQGAYKTAMPVIGAFGDVLGDLSMAFLELTGQISAADQVLRNVSEGWSANTTASEKFTDVLAGSVTEMGHWLNAVINADERQEDYINTTAEAITALGLETEELLALKEQIEAIGARQGHTTEQTEANTEAVRRAIIRQKEQEDQLAENELRMAALTGATEDQEGAQGDLASETQGATAAMREQFDLIDGRLDAFHNLTTATDDVAEKQALVNQLIADGKKGTPEYLSAVEDLAGAYRDQKDAELGVIEAGGMTRQEFIKQQVGMGLLFEDAQALANKYNELFTPRTVTHTIRTFETRENGRTYSGRAHGGPVQKGMPYVVGETGKEVFVPNESGSIIPNSKIRTGGGGVGGTVININVTALDPNAAAKAVIQAIQTYERNNGSGWRR